jgi:hypothetical protein
LLLRIHLQNADTRAANGCFSHDVNAAPSEVVIPAVSSGMEQWGDFAGLRIDAGQVGTFVQIAIDAGKGEIFKIVGASMNPGSDMFDMEGSQRGIDLIQQAILAAIFGTFPDAGFRPLVHSA